MNVHTITCKTLPSYSFDTSVDPITKTKTHSFQHDEATHTLSAKDVRNITFAEEVAAVGQCSCMDRNDIDIPKAQSLTRGAKLAADRYWENARRRVGITIATHTAESLSAQDEDDLMTYNNFTKMHKARRKAVDEVTATFTGMVLLDLLLGSQSGGPAT